MNPAPQRARTWALAFLGWTLLGLTYTTAMVGSGRVRNQLMPWGVALGVNLTSAYVWMALSPIVVAVARRAGLEARHWARALAFHLPTFALTALAHQVLWLAVYWQWGSPLFTGGAPLGAVIRNSLPWGLHDGFVVYGLLVLTLYVLHHVRKGEAEREARLALEAAVATAQLQALRAQLQPHFLFNTLNALSGLVGEDPTRAKAMIARLGHFLRLTLEAPQAGEVPLREEVRYLEAYLDIQRMRFGDRLTFSISIPEAEGELPVPHLLLQPLVENAIQHGLAPRPGRGVLAVRAGREAGCLWLEVEDDGVGLREGHGEGVGLANTRARLRARHGDAAELTLEPRPGGGAVARLRLPVEAP